MSTQRKTQSGFTLLELLVVLTIAGLLATIVPPLYSKAVPGARLKSTAREFAVSLREARDRAVNANRPVNLMLIAEPPSYAIDNAVAVRLPNGVHIAAYDYFTAGNETLADSGAASSENAMIRFYPDGSSSGAVMKVSNNGTAYRIDVSWLTGDIRLAEVGDDER